MGTFLDDFSFTILQNNSLYIWNLLNMFAKIWIILKKAWFWGTKHYPVLFHHLSVVNTSPFYLTTCLLQTYKFIFACLFEVMAQCFQSFILLHLVYFVIIHNLSLFVYHYHKEEKDMWQILLFQIFVSYPVLEKLCDCLGVNWVDSEDM